MPRIPMERSGEMEVFLRVVREGGFSAAARSLELTPSAVSKLIARLEGRLGARLLARTTRALSLTEEGEAYHRAALRIVQELDEAEQTAGSSEAVRGRLRISAPFAFGSMFIAPMIPAFLQRHPELTVDLAFIDKKADLPGQGADGAPIAYRLGQSRRVVCASGDYIHRRGVPRIPAELRHHDCLTFNSRRSATIWPFRRGGQSFDQAVSGRLQVNNAETMRQMVVAGVGIARMSLFHVAAEIEAGALIPLLESYNPGDLELIHAVHVGGGYPPGRVRAFVDHMAETLARSAVFA